MNPNDLDQEQKARLVRLFEEYKPGERVRAACTIIDAATETEIAEGTIGIVRRARVAGCTPLYAIEWCSAGDLLAFVTGWIITSAEHLEPVDRPLRGGYLSSEPGPLRDLDEAQARERGRK